MNLKNKFKDFFKSLNKGTNIYPNKLIHVDIKDGKTFIRFKALGVEHSGYLPVEEVYQDQLLLDNFKPTDVSFISFLAACEILLHCDKQNIYETISKLQKSIQDHVNNKQS